MSANESSQGLWTILTGYASVPPRCSPIERKSVQSPPYATAGKKPFFAYSDTEKFKIKRQYSSGAEDSLIFTNIPTDREGIIDVFENLKVIENNYFLLKINIPLFFNLQYHV